MKFPVVSFVPEYTRRLEAKQLVDKYMTPAKFQAYLADHLCKKRAREFAEKAIDF